MVGFLPSNIAYLFNMCQLPIVIQLNNRLYGIIRNIWIILRDIVTLNEQDACQMTTRWFGTDGIRGHVGHTPMTPGFIMKLGAAAGQILAKGQSQPVILIARDTRQSGEMLQHALTAGLLSSGLTVLDLGVCTTPGVSRLVKYLHASAGAVISASHNPVSENGVKFFNQSGFKLAEEVEAEIETLLDNMPGEFDLPAILGRQVDAGGFKEYYLADLIAEQTGVDLKGLTVVMDCANGAASDFGPAVFSRMGAQVIAIHASPSGLNINLRAGSEHVRKNPAEMGQLICLYQADFGIAFDGDADRVVLVDENGNLIDGDHILGILAGYLDERRSLRGHCMVTTKMRNQGLFDYSQSKGLTLHETKVGDKYVVEKLLENTSGDGFALGGEQSGHIILLDDDHVTGDGIRTALYMARVYVESGVKTMSELAGWMVKAPQVIASVRVKDKSVLEGHPLYDHIVKQVKEDLPGLMRIELRYSGTEPLFRAMLESDLRHTELELAEAANRICTVVQTITRTTERSLEIINCTRGGVLVPGSLL